MKKTSRWFLMGLVFLALNLGLAADFGTGTISLSPAAFHPRDWQFDTLRWYIYGTDMYFENGPDDEIGAYAAVNLPNGATVTSFTAVVTDNGTGADDEIRVQLFRHHMATGATELMAGVYTTGPAASASRQVLTDNSISYAVVDNETYTYHAFVYFMMPRSYIRFHGLKIQYWSIFGGPPAPSAGPR